MKIVGEVKGVPNTKKYSKECEEVDRETKFY